MIKISRKILSITLLSLLTFSFLSIFRVELFKVSAQATGSFTGIISDGGVDTDSDGTFNFLELGVSVNVSTAGTFRVGVSGLLDSLYNYISVWGENSTYLDVGVHVVYLSLDGSGIYSSGFNPAIVSSINLEDEDYNTLDYLFDVSLSREYNYTEFDPPPASFTGTISDGGVDTDSDGTFDYLEVSVEVNVNDAGEYEVEILELLDLNSSYISVYDDKSDYLDTGVQVVSILIYGPAVYASGLNPISISQIRLYSVEYYSPFSYKRDWISSLYDVSLSREYLYTEFDSSFKDIEASFFVYPDGRIVMGGMMNYTHMYPMSPYPSMHGIANVEKSDSSTDLTTNFTFIIPPEMASRFPFNSSDFTLLSEYSSGLLSTTISGSTILLPDIASESPFNITDFTVMGEYAGGMVEGNIIVDMWNGFPLDNIIIDFQGNSTHLHLNGSSTIIFGDYPNFGELNTTVLEQLLVSMTNTTGGQGSESLYNMTNGVLEFTMLNNITMLHNGNATVDFEAKIEGDFIQMLVNMTGQPASMYDILNTTWFSAESGSLLLTYSHALRQADMNLFFVANETYFTSNMIPILPELMSPEEAAFIESILNTTYWNVTSAQVSLDYENGQATLVVTATIQNSNAGLNYVKNQFLSYTSPLPSASQLLTLNETQIDLTNLILRLNLTETSMEVYVNGFAVIPPLDWINATSFTLERFFNITASNYESPKMGEKLKVTVEGRSNATHTVTIFQPETMTEPDLSAPGGMVWNNQSISELKNLIFQIGPLDDIPPLISTPIHTPETPDDGENVIVTVNVTDAETGVRPDGVILSYRTDGSTWKNITMSKTTGDAYEGTIQGLPAGTRVEYMILAYDYADNRAVKDKAGEYYVFTVIPEFPNWQAILLTLLLIGIILVIMKRRRNNTEDSLAINKFSLSLLVYTFI